jgi:hypothetical protein
LIEATTLERISQSRVAAVFEKKKGFFLFIRGGPDKVQGEREREREREETIDTHLIDFTIKIEVIDRDPTESRLIVSPVSESKRF